MRSEVREIPPAPRSVRLRPLLAHRWPLLFVGGALVVLGGLIAWAMFLQSGARLGYGPRLARGPTSEVTGEVLEVGNVRAFSGREWQAIKYRFSWRENQQQVPIHELSFVPAGEYAVGDAVQVRVLDHDANVSCAVGGVAHVYRAWLYPRFWLAFAVVPGALILLGWLAGVFQLRQVLMHGDVSVGRVLSVQRVRWLVPEMLVVAYEFRDHRATVRKNRHWVRARGALGHRLLHARRPLGSEALPVLHDRRLPQWNRILLPQDFLRSGQVELPPVGAP